MKTLWLKIPDEVLLSARFDVPEKEKLEKIFSTSDASSEWNKALAKLGLKHKGSPEKMPEKMITWHDDVPYFNSSAMVSAVSCRSIRILELPEGTYGFQASYSPGCLFALLVSQWKVTRFLQARLTPEWAPPEDNTEKLAESIALGLALQSLMMRFDAKSSDKMAAWLAGSELAPATHRRTIRQLQAAQVLRTRLSAAWRLHFPADSAPERKNISAPEFFWDTPQNAPLPQTSLAKNNDGVWQGLPVCTGKITGRVLTIISIDTAKNSVAAAEKPLVLVFRRARPETTELFQYADAIVFCEGGVMSHAATIAREQNIPCVTGVGVAFFEHITKSPDARISVDGGYGTVKIF